MTVQTEPHTVMPVNMITPTAQTLSMDDLAGINVATVENYSTEE